MVEYVPPRVFISYSWTNPEHEAWVLEFAERLREDGNGVEAILDKWHLKEGQNKYAFMESMVTDPTISKVLCLCDAAYQTKANGRKGGVGTESTIISKEVYEAADQEKFIPVVLERDDAGKPCLPVYFGGTMYFDLSDASRFEEEFERILRNIHNKPRHTPPPVGRPPSFVTDDEAVRLATAKKVRRLQDAFQQGRPNTPGLVAEYCDALANSLEGYTVDLSSVDRNALHEPLVASIDRFLPQRDDFIEFLQRFSRGCSQYPQWRNQLRQSFSVTAANASPRPR